MAVGLIEPECLAPVAGIRLSATNANIKRNKKTTNADLLLVEICEGAALAATFTQNKFSAAPVIVAREHFQNHSARYLLINSGNANAGTGSQGISDAKKTCKDVAILGACDAQSVLPFSTGVIGELLPHEKISASLSLLFEGLREDNWKLVAQAIMTTDTVAKGVIRQIQLKQGQITITGIAKGSGMIHPNMATMLAYIATDVRVEKNLLQEIHAKTFNRITVDGGTSTNDACILIASGMLNIDILRDSAELETLKKYLLEVYRELAQAIVRDGEGASKFVTIIVSVGSTCEECLQVANTVALSPLVKTALFASDANWGRIIAAVGRSNIDTLDPATLTLTINDVIIMRNGVIDAAYTDQEGSDAMQNSNIVIQINLGRGDFSETVWTCDLSYDYVKINTAYRT